MGPTWQSLNQGRLLPMLLLAPGQDGRAGRRTCKAASTRPDFGRTDPASRKRLVMSLSDRATIAPNREAHPILFGLFADGSGESRFRLPDAARLTASPGLAGGSGFSPSGDWYGRWTVRPLHGVLATNAAPAGTVCPDDIVVLDSARPRRS